MGDARLKEAETLAALEKSRPFEWGSTVPLRALVAYARAL
jgi:hypothetical protein